MNLIFIACVAYQIKSKLDQKPSFSNSIFQTRDFKNQMQINNVRMTWRLLNVMISY